MTDQPPPSYEAVASFSHQRQQNNTDTPPLTPARNIPIAPPTHYQTAPPYRACHYFASPEEELAALQEFAKSKMYITPGTEGTLAGETGLPMMVGRGYQVNVDSEQLKRERIQMLESRKREKREKQAKQAKKRQKEEAKQAKKRQKEEAKQAKKRQKEEAKRVARENEPHRDDAVAPVRKMSVGDRVGSKLRRALSRGNSGSEQYEVIR